MAGAGTDSTTTHVVFVLPSEEFEITVAIESDGVNKPTYSASFMRPRSEDVIHVPVDVYTETLVNGVLVQYPDDESAAHFGDDDEDDGERQCENCGETYNVEDHGGAEKDNGHCITATCQALAEPENAETYHLERGNFDQLGALAFEAGAKRIVPRDILVDHGVDAARAWYQGWDRANLAAPVPEDTQP